MRRLTTVGRASPPLLLILLSWLMLLATATTAAAMSEPKRTFPALTGRIVDDAGIVPPETKARIEPKLKDLETKSGIQLVVATVKSLGGNDIESYANELFRFWKLGEVKNNNGALLIVALDDHKVRIEVGYGLEGTLTDAATSLIIASDMVPRFKAKDYGGGIERGVDDIIRTLSADAGEWAHRPPPAPRRDDVSWISTTLPILLFAGILLVMVFAQNRGGGGPGGRYRRGGDTMFFPIPSGGGGGFSGGDSGGFSGGDGGFSGGGGSSGGGGASGSW